VYELDVDEVGVSLARATAKVTKNPAAGSQRQAPADDPWTAAKPASPASDNSGAPF
jgi:single-strand DNA-binding protein